MLEFQHQYFMSLNFIWNLFSWICRKQYNLNSFSLLVLWNANKYGFLLLACSQLCSYDFPPWVSVYSLISATTAAFSVPVLLFNTGSSLYSLWENNDQIFPKAPAIPFNWLYIFRISFKAIFNYIHILKWFNVWVILIYF